MPLLIIDHPQRHIECDCRNNVLIVVLRRFPLIPGHIDSGEATFSCEFASFLVPASYRYDDENLDLYWDP